MPSQITVGELIYGARRVGREDLSRRVDRRFFSVFGGFVTGMAMPDVPAFRRMIHDRMMEMTTVLLLPVFFAYSGLNTHLGSGWTWSFVGALRERSGCRRMPLLMSRRWSAGASVRSPRHDLSRHRDHLPI